MSSVPRKTWALFVVWIAALLFVATAATASSGKCARKGSEINTWRECVKPGASCGAGCVCTNVSGFGWRDCECVRSGGGGGGCRFAGQWRVARVSGQLGPGESAGFKLEPAKSNLLEVFLAANIGPDGKVKDSKTFSDAEAVRGTFQLRFGEGAKAAIPVYLTELQVDVTSIDFEGKPTGTNSIRLEPGGERVAGVYDATGGTIQFDEPVPCVVRNEHFPDGLRLLIRPVLSQTADAGAWVALLSSSLELP